MNVTPSVWFVFELSTYLAFSIICLTLEECEDSKPCERTVAGYLEHDENCYQGYGRLKKFTTLMQSAHYDVCFLLSGSILHKIVQNDKE